MKTSVKIIITMAVIIGGVFIQGVLSSIGGGEAPPVTGLILVVVMIAMLRAIWKKDSENESVGESLNKN